MSIAINIVIGEQVALARKSKSLTQQELAQAIGVTQGYVSDIEQGKKIPGSDILLSLKEALRVSADRLLTGKDEEGRAYTPNEQRYIDMLIEILRGQNEKNKKAIKENIEALYECKDFKPDPAAGLDTKKNSTG